MSPDCTPERWVKPSGRFKYWRRNTSHILKPAATGYSGDGGLVYGATTVLDPTYTELPATPFALT